jgi:hypothetical protein
VPLEIPIIFLDFDGVLHPVDYLSFREVNGELILTGDSRCCWTDVLWNLIKDFDCSLVIHSSWRNSYTLDELRNLLSGNIGKRVIATTEGEGRYASILRYVEHARVNAYMILDDSADEFPSDCAELVLCDGSTGISHRHIQDKVLTFLKRAHPA